MLDRVLVIHRRDGLSGVARRAFRAALWRASPSRRRHVREMKEQQRQDDEYDRRHGVSTCGDLPLTSLGIGSEDAKRGNGIYRPVWGELFHCAMAELEVDHRRYVFLDYGSGKGKALLLASDYPFRRIIGIEYSEPLHRAAIRDSVQRSPRPCLLLYVNIRNTREKRPVFQQSPGLQARVESRRFLVYELSGG